MVSREGYIRYNHTQFVLWDCGLIRGVASVEVATYRVTTTVALYTVLTSCHTTNVILLYIRPTCFVLSLTSIHVTDVISDCHTICLCHNRHASPSYLDYLTRRGVAITWIMFPYCILWMLHPDTKYDHTEHEILNLNDSLSFAYQAIKLTVQRGQNTL